MPTYAPATDTGDNNTNQNKAQPLTTAPVVVISFMTNVDPAPKPTAVNLGGGGQVGYAT